MLHCIACDASCPPWEEYCNDCLEVIAHWYDPEQSQMEFNFYGTYPDHISDAYIEGRKQLFVWDLDSN